MILVPLTECCLQLGIDPKTLRLWLKTAHLSCCQHPTDARLKCLTHDQLTQLAALHDRHVPALAESGMPPAPIPPSLPTTSPPAALPSSEVADLRHQLALLQAQVLTLQTQVTELALALLRSTTASSPVISPPLCTPPPTPRPKTKALPAASPPPEPPRPRSRAVPLIEVRPDGSSVVIVPDAGVLPLVPDSAEWFAWLASLSRFAFQGQQGCFSATRKFRDGQRIQAWMVHRSLHGRSCGLYLGQTPPLTLARLEEMAAIVQTRLTSL
jgi:hypothetical protein